MNESVNQSVSRLCLLPSGQTYSLLQRTLREQNQTKVSGVFQKTSQDWIQVCWNSNIPYSQLYTLCSILYALYSTLYAPVIIIIPFMIMIIVVVLFLSIVETPARAASSAPAAYYLGPAGDGSRPGTVYVNTYKHDTRCAFTWSTAAA